MASVYISNIKPIGFGSSDSSVTSVSIGEDGKISATNGQLPPGATVVDGKGAYLSPGWADLHAHVWYGGTDLGVMMSQAGAARGVTTVVDAGSAGEANFHGFREFIWKPNQQQNQSVFALLNLGSPGLVASKHVTELIDARSIDPDRMVEVIQSNKDVIVGIKLRASGVILNSWGITPVKVAKKISRIVGLPLMCHVGEAPPTVDEVADLLEKGDIITHTYNGKVGGSLKEDPHLLKALQEASARGVYLDIGHGAASFSFDVFKFALDKGLKPYSISTDIHARNVNGAVRDMATTMSKMLNLGMTLQDVVVGSTLAPLRAIRQKADDFLKVGSVANFTIFDLVDGNEVVTDSGGANLTLKKNFEPRWAVMGARAVQAARHKPQTSSNRLFSLSDMECC